MGRLRKCDLEDKSYICVLPAFFTYYAMPKGFPSSIVFTNACETLGMDSTGIKSGLMNEFLTNGAATFLGWVNPVNDPFAHRTIQDLIGLLTQSPQLNIGDAYDNLPAGHTDTQENEDHTHGKLLLGGSRSQTLCQPTTNFLFDAVPGAGPILTTATGRWQQAYFCPESTCQDSAGSPGGAWYGTVEGDILAPAGMTFSSTTLSYPDTKPITVMTSDPYIRDYLFVDPPKTTSVHFKFYSTKRPAEL